VAKIILISGGARSGKSTFAEQLALQMDKPIAYLATAQALDQEMAERIKNHQKRRPAHLFHTFEEPYNLKEVLLQHHQQYRTWLLDCLTLYISNLLFAQVDANTEINQNLSTELAEKLLSQLNALLTTLAELELTIIVVTNEVGWGLVPADPVSRAYRDILGIVNQRMAAAADEVYLLTMGIPLKIK
jgi:adenosylcobinamide kinase/adenosylcobinamide-phosphate guanylyltransferase